MLVEFRSPRRISIGPPFGRSNRNHGYGEPCRPLESSRNGVCRNTRWRCAVIAGTVQGESRAIPEVASFRVNVT
jgi:hypothetical protein